MLLQRVQDLRVEERDVEVAGPLLELVEPAHEVVGRAAAGRASSSARSILSSP